MPTTLHLCMQMYLLFLSHQHEPHEGRDHLGFVLTLSPLLESTWLKTEEPRAGEQKDDEVEL